MDIETVFKALGDQSRLKLYSSLLHGSFNVQELTHILDLRQSTVSHHLKILEKSDLIQHRKEGTWSYYSLTELEDATLISDTRLLLQKLMSNGHNPLSDDEQQRVKGALDSRRDRSRMYFDANASRWHTLREEAPGSHFPLDTLLSEIDSERTLLDLGCGSGALLERLLPRAGKTFAVDYSDAMLDAARENLGTRAKEIDFRLGYLEHLPFGDGTVEVATGFMVFHHLAEPRSALSDIHRVLTPGGKLIIGDLLPHTKEFMRDRFADLWLGFPLEEFQSWVGQAGFSQIETAPIGPEKDVFLLTAYKP